MENDRHYSLNDLLKDYLEINKEIGAPNVFDILHHEYLNNNEAIQDALAILRNTWKCTLDGYHIMDYSIQRIGYREGKHAKTMDKNHFIFYYKYLKRFFCNEHINLDIML
jgi:UV DNA damage repair endonuclease